MRWSTSPLYKVEQSQQDENIQQKRTFLDPSDRRLNNLYLVTEIFFFDSENFLQIITCTNIICITCPYCFFKKSAINNQKAQFVFFFPFFIHFSDTKIVTHQNYQSTLNIMRLKLNSGSNFQTRYSNSASNGNASTEIRDLHFFSLSIITIEYMKYDK